MREEEEEEEALTRVAIDGGGSELEYQMIGRVRVFWCVDVVVLHCTAQ